MAATVTATNSKKTNRKNSIGGFFVDKVDGDVMRKYLVTTSIPTDKVDPTSEDEGLGVALSLYFREQVAEGAISDDDMAKCEICGGEGPATGDCAFCGNGGEASDPTSTEALAAKVEAEEPKSGKKKKTTKTGAVTEAETTTTKETAMTSVALATVNGKGKHENQIVLSDKDLDEAVKRVFECKKVASVGLWALGNELRKINEDKLWKLRVVKGKQAYTSFDQFCDAEAKIGHTYAYNLIDIATKFTDRDVAKFGPSKLTLMLKVADEDLPKVREIAGKVGKRQLAKEVAEVVRERGHGAKKKSKKGTAKTAAATKASQASRAKAARASDKITIASIEGTKKVKLFAKPASIRDIDWKALKRAKTTDAIPFGKLELTNEVTLFISIVKTDDGLEAICNFRRDTSE